LEECGCQQQHGARCPGREDRQGQEIPRPDSFARAGERRARSGADAPERGKRERGCHGFAQGANLFFNTATIFAAAQVSLDSWLVTKSARRRIRVKKFGDLVVIDIHFV